MQPVIQHSWDISENEAIILQQQLAPKVIQDDHFEGINLVAGVDVAYAKESDEMIAAVVMLNAHTLEIVETATATHQSTFPYIAGLFSFREIPVLLEAIAKLHRKPDLIVCDGQGYAHPRRFGLACHLGVLFDLPTIGCGKTRLLGEHKEVPSERGQYEFLEDNREVIGAVLRTQTNIKPVYVSVGHRMSLPTAINWILKLTPKYRLPETTRTADQLVRKTQKEALDLK
ncbi:deoxyribonuclease V [Flocculibacter collagenilyticus]|uniref:deoxyribonuclease V n=1 Tax=Flocculibacter collagenilyticus TaxID=2744479 RepID=UPI0018F31DE9|nr:deoxyribonuclease V [Flocculibacter collagenilyticus]